MSIRVEDERAFYDAQYTRLLQAPDHALLCAKADMQRFLADPTHPLYERRRLYCAALHELTRTPLHGLRVLDYGCGPSDWGIMMATEGARVTLLDLSPVAIEFGLRRARANSVAQRVDGVARDAADLSVFDDGQFDLVYANAALHHTIKYPGAFEELVRVISPQGRLVLAETLGNNPLLNQAREWRARLSGQPEEQGEEVILSDAEIDQLRARFTHLTVRPFHLLSMSKRLARGHFAHPLVKAAIAVCEGFDAIALTAIPPLRRYCGEALIVCEQPR